MTEQHINSKGFHNVAVMYYLFCLSAKQEHYMFSVYTNCLTEHIEQESEDNREDDVPAHHYSNHCHYQSSVHDSSLLPFPPTAGSFYKNSFGKCKMANDRLANHILVLFIFLFIFCFCNCEICHEL